MFWSWLASFIIRQRLPLLIFIGVLTVFFGWKARDVQMSYDYLSILPKKDAELAYFKEFKKTFGEDGNIIVIGCKDKNLFSLGGFNRYKQLNDSLGSLKGVKEIISIPNLKLLTKDTVNKKFVLTRLNTDDLRSQHQLDSVLTVFRNQKLYHNQIFNPTNQAVLMALTIDNDYIVTDKRLGLVRKIQKLGADFEKDTQIKLHFGGIPYIRSVMSLELGGELKLFLFLSVLVSAITLFIFFRTWDSVFIPLLLIGVIILWTFGSIAIFQYKMTILTGLIPSLIVITGIPNFIYLINKYHQEFGLHQNKLKAIAQIIRSIGVVTLIVNATTAVGFLVLCNNDVTLMREFGVIAGLNIMSAFVVTIIIVPALLVYLPEPSIKKMKHLDSKILNKIIEWSLTCTFKYKNWVYALSALVLLVS
ncbi:MAG: MMPL family transporter, partial [Cytophagales bacterium]